MTNLMYLLSSTSSIVGGSTTGTSSTEQATTGVGFMPNPIIMVLVYCLVIFGILYFFSIRPQKKRDAEAETMRSNIKVGDSVLLNNGMYGVVSDITAECFIIEFGTNKTIRIPVIKQQVALVKEPNLSNKEVAKIENNK